MGDGAGLGGGRLSVKRLCVLSEHGAAGAGEQDLKPQAEGTLRGARLCRPELLPGRFIMRGI